MAEALRHWEQSSYLRKKQCKYQTSNFYNNMRKLKRFILSSSCKSLCNEAMLEIVGGAGNGTSCSINSNTCSGSCSYAEYTGSCVYGSVGPLTGCYCLIH